MADNEIPDEVEQQAAVDEFFDTLGAEDTTDESAEALSAGEQAIADALNQGEETEEDEDDADEPSEEPGDDDGPDESDDADGDGDEAEDEPEEDVHPAELARRRAQSEADAKIAALSKQVEQLQQYAQQVYQAQMQAAQAQQAAQTQTQQANPYGHVTKEHVVKGVEENLVGTFQTVAAYRPDLMATTIAAAREKYGNEVGDDMQLQYNQYLIQQQQAAQEAQWEAQRQAQAEAEAPVIMQQQMAGLVDGIKQQYGEAFNEIESDFIAYAQETAPAFREYMDQQGLEMTPDALHYFLTKCVNDVRERRLNAQASKPRRARKVAPQETVESSTNGAGNRPEDMTPDEIAINELLEGARELQMEMTNPDR